MSAYRFRTYATPPGTSLSVQLGPFGDRCGIYVLRFADGEQYVGQSVDVVNRFTSHRRRWDDIQAIEFCHVSREILDDAEKETIQLRRDAGVRLRNSALRRGHSHSV